jgi:hypothetical protein
MSQRTFCDRCGKQCLGHLRSVIHLTELHFADANPREPVGEDSYRPADLCDVCTVIIKEALGKALVPGEHYDRLEMAQDSARMGVPEDTRLVHFPPPFPPDLPTHP